MIERTRRRIDAIKPATVIGLIVVFGTIAIASFVLSFVALNTRVDERGQQATRDALCAVWSYQIPRAGEPGPTTERGRLMVDRALEQYRALECKPTR